MAFSNSPPPPADVPLADGVAPAAPWAIPPTLPIWLLLLLLAFSAPRILDMLSVKTQKARTAETREAGLTGPDFEKYLSAEAGAKGAFGVQAVQNRLQGTGGSGGALSAQSTGKMLEEAVANYRDLLKTNPSPNVARRILVLEHALRKPLDETLLTGQLQNALAQAKETASDQNDEIALWRGIYGDGVQSADFVPNGEKRIRAMKLRFYENRVLADLYQAAGEKQKAQTAQDAFEQSASRFTAREAGVSGTIFCCLVVGIGFLIVFIVAASSQSWSLVKRVVTQNQPLQWGDLLDVFVFYLMTIFVARPVVGLLAARFLPKPTLQTALCLSAGVYVGTALIATAYLAHVLRKHKANWRDVGFRAPHGLLSNIAYGLAGYCVTLPFSLALGAVSKLIFRHNPNTAPNPVLPLIAGEHELVGRVIIYLLAAVAAPLFEELFFRGVLFSGLRTRFGWVASALISGACFALVHPMQDWLPIFGLGFVFAAMREMRQSLIPGMVGHFCQNSFAFVTLSVLFGE